MVVLWQVGSWYSRHRAASAKRPAAAAPLALPRRKVVIALVVLAMLMFSKNVYMASLSSYYTFYLIEKFGVSVQDVADPAVPLPRRGRGRHRGSAGRSATASAPNS